jgi:hypothetical protein
MILATNKILHLIKILENLFIICTPLVTLKQFCAARDIFYKVIWRKYFMRM